MISDDKEVGGARKNFRCRFSDSHGGATSRKWEGGGIDRNGIASF